MLLYNVCIADAADYTLLFDEVTISAGMLRACVTVVIEDDADWEGAEVITADITAVDPAIPLDSPWAASAELIIQDPEGMTLCTHAKMTLEITY